MSRLFHQLAVITLFSFGAFRAATGTEVVSADICVYGATPGGILAAIAVQREGRSVVVVEPSRWVGGMLGAGLKPMQDCPNFAATGGMTHELLKTLGAPEWDSKGGLVRASLGRTDLVAIREDFLKLLRDRKIPVRYEHRIARCEKDGARIRGAVFDLAPFDSLGCPVAEPTRRDSLRVEAKIFIDASYEGDLFAAAGVSSRVGREASAEFGEEAAGRQVPMEEAPIDPFVTPGKRESGMLKWVEASGDLPLGSGDRYTQAYNYRYYTTSDPAARIEITPPPGYDPADYELIGRYVSHLAATIPDQSQLFNRLSRIFPGWMNSAEWNYHRDSLFSMAPVGISHLYAGGDYAAKARVWKEHQNYLRGLHAFFSTDSRVPEEFRKKTAAIGLDGRFHPETGGWPHQLYIRVARRMEGRYMITAHDVYNRTTIADPVALAQYGIDTYPARRVWFERDGKTWVGLEGKMFVGGSHGPTNMPYPIPYRALTPKVEQCTNLLVPVCFSASHLGYASARMEPVFMICGESSGIAACRALSEGTTVQEIDPDAYRKALEGAGQKLVWDGPPPARGSSAPQTIETLLGECDRNGDKLVSEQEWKEAKPGWEWLFAYIDKDKNGQLTGPEYRSLQDLKVRYPKTWQDEAKKETKKP
jgi:hypothetical protein